MNECINGKSNDNKRKTEKKMKKNEERHQSIAQMFAKFGFDFNKNNKRPQQTIIVITDDFQINIYTKCISNWNRK